MRIKNKEQNFTSVASKLYTNLERLQSTQSGLYHPITLQIAPTNKCNLKCDFCYNVIKSGQENHDKSALADL